MQAPLFDRSRSVAVRCFGMSNQAKSPQSDPGLRHQIDDLATQLILGGQDRDALGALGAALLTIEQGAQKAGYHEAARVAAAVAKQVRIEPDATSCERLLREGLAQLQHTIEAEERTLGSPAETAQPSASTANPLAGDPELLSDFVLESREHLASIERQLLVLEQDPANQEAIHSAFRDFHSIKGLAGFLDLTAIREVAHEVETALDLARNGNLEITPDVIDIILESSDYLRESVRQVEESLGSGAPAEESDYSGLLSRIRGLSGDSASQAPKSELSPAADAVPPARDVGAAPGPANAPSQKSTGSVRQGASQEGLKVRVDASKLDYLMDMVGEMVIAQSLVRHHPLMATLKDTELSGGLSQLTRISGEVQRTTMALRMVPVGQVFQRTARVVRDLARKAGRLVEFETAGEDTELDKTIAEELADPLMHMVRNSIDHGIEGPEERQAAGKPTAGRLRLAAYHQAGLIVVEVADDGRGLSREKILRRAVQRGLVDPSAVLSDLEVYNLIFEPGFSTAEEVTDVSGRGVGMDVVRKHVQKLRGRVEIASKPGQGTTFFIRLPLTLAIIDGLVVGVGVHRYIVPLFAVREMFRPTAETISTVQGRNEMALVRGRLLPIVRLYRRFGVEPRCQDPCEALFIVVESDDLPFCMMVDEMIGKQEVVIKSLGTLFKDVAGIAGGAILGDGRIGLIVDVAGLYRQGAA